MGREFQLLLNGKMAPAGKLSIKDLMAMAPEEATSKERVEWAFMNSDEVTAFCENAVGEDALEIWRMLHELIKYRAFETFARAQRRSTGEDIEAVPRQAINDIRPPKGWYDMYCETEWWRDLSRAKKELHDGGCSLCSSEDGLQSHHRNYARLCREEFSDLTILCGCCHSGIHKKGVVDHVQFPPRMPLVVRQLLESEQH